MPFTSSNGTVHFKQSIEDSTVKIKLKSENLNRTAMVANVLYFKNINNILLSEKMTK
jgi:hypothetical protein